MTLPQGGFISAELSYSDADGSPPADNNLSTGRRHTLTPNANCLLNGQDAAKMLRFFSKPPSVLLPSKCTHCRARESRVQGVWSIQQMTSNTARLALPWLACAGHDATRARTRKPRNVLGRHRNSTAVSEYQKGVGLKTCLATRMAGIFLQQLSCHLRRVGQAESR